MTDDRKQLLPVTVASAFGVDPAPERLSLPEGQTIAEIVAAALPGMVDADDGCVRVALVTTAGQMIIPPEQWRWVHPKAGVHVVIRVLPGKDSMRTILMIVVAVAAIALGNIGGPVLAGIFKGTTAAMWSGIIGLGVSAIGELQVDGLLAN